MKKFFGIYASSGDVMDALKNKQLEKPYVAVVEGEGIDYNTQTVIDYKSEYLTFEILSDGEVWMVSSSNSDAKIWYYSVNGGNWTQAYGNSDGSVNRITVTTGDKIRFSGNNKYYSDRYFKESFQTSCQFKVSGNIMSLTNRTSFDTLTVLEEEYSFHSLFKGCTGLTDASNLVLPAQTLTKYCYMEMFRNCINLTTAPELPATTLAESCYQTMFNGCSKLNYIKCLATNNSAAGCTSTWVLGVASNGTFVKAAGVTWGSGSNGIPSWWTIIEE